MKFSKSFLGSAVLFLIIVAGCSSNSQRLASQEESAPSITIPPPQVSAPTPTQTGSVAPTEDISPDPSLHDDQTKEVEVTKVSTEITQPGQSSDLRYQVAYVLENDVLNVRRGPGVSYDVVGELSPGEQGINAIGRGETVESSLWLPIRTSRISGWVNSRYLVEEISSGDFCAAIQASTLVEDIVGAFKEEDGKQLESLIAEMRGLKVRRHWWNPEVRYDHDQIESLFTKDDQKNWGRADGSGEPIVGNFSQVIGPLLDRNLSLNGEMGCNEILHGGTAGIVKLPPEYEGINYISLYRAPGPEEFEMDWGTWVFGIEHWQDAYFLTYMVHYEWEI